LYLLVNNNSTYDQCYGTGELKHNQYLSWQVADLPTRIAPFKTFTVGKKTGRMPACFLQASL